MKFFRRLWEFFFGPKKVEETPIYTDEPVIIADSVDLPQTQIEPLVKVDACEDDKPKTRVNKKRATPVTLLAATKKTAKKGKKSKKSG